MSKISTLIIDDEPLARERIRKLLALEKEFDIVGEAENGLDALNLIIELKPDLIFLDIQMPMLNGFEVLGRLEQNSPEIIFVTAYDAFAIKAFEVNAVDYLLKPFDKERFFDSLEKVKEKIIPNKTNKLNDNIQALLNHVSDKERKKYRERFVIKKSGRIFFIDTNDVDWFEADGNYIKLHIGVKTELIRDTIKNIEEQLDSELFIRVHRSVIIKISSIKEISTWFNNSYKIYLKNGDSVVSGKKYQGTLKKMIK